MNDDSENGRKFRRITRDCSDVQDTEDDRNSVYLSSDDAAVGGAIDEGVTLFIRKAYALFSNCPAEVAGWTPDGERVYVEDPEVFARDWIPTVYRHRKYSSFVRQLHVYGFNKVLKLSTVSTLPHVYRNHNFVRDKPELMRLLRRLPAGSHGNYQYPMRCCLLI